MTCAKGFIVNQELEVCECAKNKPYLAFNNTCIACDTDFDVETMDCVKCVNGTIWMKEDRSCSCPEDSYLAYNNTCISCKTLFDEEQLDCIKCENNTVWNRTSKTCVCPPEKNYTTSDGSCVSCTSPDFWDPKTLKCFRCPAGF
jgi:hypothetical protein